ncbi:hypothetical protein R1sor_022176 [Riccia sorocarpa]|uniref:Cysteine proteinase inhibitor n=1 Tax=Riccia sorocarpa TaxID=122646 RepID=A0ABD3GMA0_9MARC
MKALSKNQHLQHKSTRYIFLLLLVVGAFAVVGACTCREKQSEENAMAGLLGAPKEVNHSENSAEMDEIGQFAVDQYNTKEGKNLSFHKIISAKKQVVAGTMYHLVIEAHGDEAVKNYEAKVWHKPYENHKSLEQFKPHDGSANSASQSEVAGMRSVSGEDPVIKEAADHALKGLNDRSNSLVPYELRQVLSAHAEASDEETNISLRLKVARGAKEEEVKADLHRTPEGKWTVKHAGPL